MAKIDRLLDVLLEKKATDLHLRVGAPPMVRLKGELIAIAEQPLEAGEMDNLLMEIVSLEQRSRVLDEHELDFAYGYAQKAFRGNYFHTIRGLAGVLRRVPLKIPALADLHLPETLSSLVERRSGLVLVTGPARCGKSVTLSSMIQHLNVTRGCHVVSIEDPIEFVHEPRKAQITQREVGLHAPSFAAALRAAIADDAEVIALSDFPDHHTMRLALETASAGVLVIGTMATPNATTTLERIVEDAPVADRPHLRVLLSRTLCGVASQQLVELADGKGRVAAVEIVLASRAVREAIALGQPLNLPSLVLASELTGMQTMDMALEKLVGSGLITPAAALEKAADRDAFLRLGGKTSRM